MASDGKGDGKGAASMPPNAMHSDAVAEKMNTAILKELRTTFMSEEPGMTTKVKATIAQLNDSTLQVLSALDILGSPFVYDLPLGMGSFRSVDILTGTVHGQSLAACNSSAVPQLPIPIEVFSTIAKDSERLIPFLEFGSRSSVTPRAIRTLCAVAALAQSLGPGTITSMVAMGYVLELTDFQALVVSSSSPGNPIGFLPPDMCTPERHILRTSLPSIQLSSIEVSGGEDTTHYSRVVPVSITGKLAQIPELASAFQAYGEIVQQAGSPSLSRGKRFMIRFLTTCFACIGRSYQQPLENVFVDASKDVMEAFTYESVKSKRAPKASAMPTGLKRRRKAAAKA